MGDIAFNIDSNVNINKVVNFDIDKNVDVNVDNPDQLATAQSDAEAFGRQALAETDTYTFVTETEAFSYSESVSALDLEPEPEPPLATPGGIDVDGTTNDFFAPVGDPITIVFEDLDDLDPLLDLEDLYPVPDGLQDLGLPDPVSGISFDDFDLEFNGNLDPLMGNYELATDSIFNYGEVTLTVDLDGSNDTLDDRVTLTDDLLVIFPEGTLFGVENIPNPDTDIDVQLVSDDPFLSFGSNTWEIDAVFNAGAISGLEGNYLLIWQTVGDVFVDPSDA